LGNSIILDTILTFSIYLPNHENESFLLFFNETDETTTLLD